jgi:hypothetical protein
VSLNDIKIVFVLFWPHNRISTAYESNIPYNALQDSGRWPGCRYTKDIITIHAVVDDQEQARSLIRSAIEGYPVFSNNIKKVLISRSA